MIALDSVPSVIPRMRECDCALVFRVLVMALLAVSLLRGGIVNLALIGNDLSLHYRLLDIKRYWNKKWHKQLFTAVRKLWEN